MSIADDLRTWLLTQSDVTDVVGTRIAVGHAKRGEAFPRLLVSNISGPLENDLGGANPHASPTFQLTAFDTDGVVAGSMGPILRDTLANANTAGGITMGSTTVQGVEVLSVVDLPPVLQDDATNEYIYSTAVDIQLWYAT